MSSFEEGEVVDITIEGARIYRHLDGIGVRVVIPGGVPYYTEIPTDYDAVTITRADPAEWPPQPVLAPPEAYEQRHRLTLAHREEATDEPA